LEISLGYKERTSLNKITGEKFHDNIFKNNFLNIVSKAQTAKVKINNGNYIKLITRCVSMDTIKNGKTTCEM
jgi:hypothetical protein